MNEAVVVSNLSLAVVNQRLRTQCTGALAMVSVAKSFTLFSCGFGCYFEPFVQCLGLIALFCFVLSGEVIGQNSPCIPGLDNHGVEPSIRTLP